MKIRNKLFIVLASLMLATLLLVSCGGNPTEGEFEFEFKSDGTYILSSVGTVKDANIVIPDKHNNLPVSTIGVDAFADCTFIRTVTIPSSVTTIESNAFGGCTKLKNLNIPVTVTAISASAFNNTGYYNDSNNWEGDLLYCGEWLLGTKKLISGDCVVKDGTKYIAEFAFYGCANLKSVSVPSSVTSIGKYVFGMCVSLESVTIPESVTSIGAYAFSNCMNMKAITIPKSVTSIGNAAFEDCEGLTVSCSFTSNGFIEGDTSRVVILGVDWNDGVASIVYYGE